MIISKKIVEKVELKGKHVGSNSIHSSVKKIYKFTVLYKSTSKTTRSLTVTKYK